MTESQPNVDAAEVAKFDALASRWWDPDGEFRPLHAINPLRLDWIRQYVDLDGCRALDVGCGGGILTEAMAECGATVTGIDMAEKPLGVARLHKMESGADVDYQQTTAEALAADLEHHASIGLHYNPFTREYSLGSNVDVNYLMYFRRPEAS